MTLDTIEQQRVLLELIARAHKAPEEVPGVERLRRSIATAEIAEKPAAPPTP